MEFKSTSRSNLLSAVKAATRKRLMELCVVYGVAPITSTADDAVIVSDPRADLLRAAERSVEAAIPHMDENSPCVSIILPVVWKAAEPYAVGASIGQDAYAEARVSIVIAVTKELEKPLVSACVMRNGINRGSPGGIYLHNTLSGTRQRLYAYDDDLEITSVRASPFARPQKARKYK